MRFLAALFEAKRPPRFFEYERRRATQKWKRSGSEPVSAFGVLVKCASAVPRSVQAGGWSPFRDVYGCVVAKWLHAIAPCERAVHLLRGARRVEDLGSSGSPGSWGETFHRRGTRVTDLGGWWWG